MQVFIKNKSKSTGISFKKKKKKQQLYITSRSEHHHQKYNIGKQHAQQNSTPPQPDAIRCHFGDIVTPRTQRVGEGGVGCTTGATWPIQSDLFQN
jgi:hypothetical protein